MDPKEGSEVVHRSLPVGAGQGEVSCTSHKNHPVVGESPLNKNASNTVRYADVLQCTFVVWTWTEGNIYLDPTSSTL